ncbi:hypothetical protein FE257_000173 [Aspergillus nanangensis]|uniref:Glycosyl hydrolase n=1 Tax=Aspergillus nanangensis TaxID=2582783 RepID=A0AAD4H000_ASPNN|nr:hypothetical protein FE257_000173 [Aspergillus nanangensis]
MAHSALATNTYQAHAKAGVETLQGWYNKSTGLWDTAGWWVSANCMTALADMTELDSSMLESSTSVFENTLSRAPAYKSQPVLRIMSPDQQLDTGKTVHGANEGSSTDFINGFYDDEGWWALGFIKAYDVTHDAKYLTAATRIFEDMTTGWGATCGGVWWDKAHTANAAIANEIFLSTAAHLARRVPGKKGYYLHWAEKEWEWFRDSGLINDQDTINDGLDLASCRNNGETVWSYNQGVILGGLVELSRATYDTSMIETAHKIATGAIKALSDGNGVLHESCDPDCTGDGTQFKGIFMRNLQRLQEESPRDYIRDFLRRNADSIWENDRGDGNKFGAAFAGPYATANASTQSAASDALIAAAAVLE